MLGTMLDANQVFSVPLEDLGVSLSPRFEGILAPTGEASRPKVGVTEQFTRDAAEYSQRYLNAEYFGGLLKAATSRFEPGFEPRVILDLGSGSGNSVLPALRIFPGASIVATDISEELLRILRDHLRQAPDDAQRISLVCMDAARNLFNPESVDLVVGAAILHHLKDPSLALAAAAHALRKGGYAVFFEPFENGNSIVRLAYQAILREAPRQAAALEAPVSNFLAAMIRDLEVRTGTDKTAPIYDQIDDKWLFTRSYFESCAERLGLRQLLVYPLHETSAPFSAQTRTNLRLAIGRDASALPPWAWDIIAGYDTVFSAELKRDLLIEGCVLLRK